MPSPRLTTPGRLLFGKAVPEKYRDIDYTLDRKGMTAFLETVAEQDPDLYPEILQNLSDLGREVVTDYGKDASVTLDDLEMPPALQRYREQIRRDIHTISQSSLPKEEKSKKIVDYMKSRIKEIQTRVLDDTLAKGNRYAQSVKSGVRGRPLELTQLLFGDLLVSDHRGRPLPIPGLHGYGEGVTPAEYWAAGYGSRQGYCLSPETQVRMSDGCIRMMKDIFPGQYVLGADGQGNTFPVKVLDTFRHGPKKMYTWVFRDGKEDREIHITATPEHEVLAQEDSCAVKLHLCDIASMRLPVLCTFTENGVPESRTCAYLRKEAAGLRLSCDLAVDSPEHLFVLANGFIVSNSSVQFATADTGYFAKQLGNMSGSVRVMTDDCGTQRGVPFDGDNPDIIGSILMSDTGGLKAGTQITKDNFPLLSGKQPVIRSLVTCEEEDGVCVKCAGARETGKLPNIGASIGLDSARATSEPLTQEIGLSAKHSGGAVGKDDLHIGAFDEINQFMQARKNFVGEAVLAEQEGKVHRIGKAPQGGTYITVGMERYYVHPGLEPAVKEGDSVEQGDMLSEGTPNPEKVVRLKGIGEGRRYIVQKFGEILRKHNAPTHRRNLDAIARAYAQYVEITDPDGVSGFGVGDVVPYEVLQKQYSPRKTAETKRVSSSKGAYLEKSVLHYTVGTRVTKSVQRQLRDAGVDEVTVSKDPPGFEPKLVRMQTSLENHPDWKTRLAGFGLKKVFLDTAQHGGKSVPGSASFVPDLMDPSRL
jgi:hypothetical protein